MRVYPEIVEIIRTHLAAAKPDLIHINTNHLYTSSVIRATEKLTIPVVYFVHDSRTLSPLNTWWFRKAYPRFIFMTHSILTYGLLAAQKRNARLIKVPFDPVRWLIHSSTHPEPVQNDLLYVGRLEKNKGVYLLVKAMEEVNRKIPGIKLTLLGDGSQRKRLEALIEKKKLQQCIFLRGHQPDEEIIRYYRGSKIMVLPSLDESLGYVGLEAQTLGLPVIAFETDGVKRWCRHLETGVILSEKTPASLARAIVTLLEDPGRMARYAENARQISARKPYNASDLEIEEAYLSILS